MFIIITACVRDSSREPELASAVLKMMILQSGNPDAMSQHDSPPPGSLYRIAEKTQAMQTLDPELEG